jgi:NAD-dependent dihydropyrimidine dehydrogenase PreA subunit
VAYVITGSCVKDDSCLGACPVDCIHPKPGDPDFETAEQLYIDPSECIECDACVSVCPVDAIHSDLEVPAQHEWSLGASVRFFEFREGR